MVARGLHAKELFVLLTSGGFVANIPETKCREASGRCSVVHIAVADT